MASWVLAIDTAGPVVGVCGWDVGGGSHDWSSRAGRGADTELLPEVQGLLRERPEGPSLIAVSVGPGSFTGLRVGVATALGVAVARGCSVVPLSSLEVRAMAVQDPSVLALLDARKGRVYAQQFDTSGPVPVALGDARDVVPERAMPATAFVATGEGALVFRDLVEGAGGRVGPGADQLRLEVAARLAWSRREGAQQPEFVALRYLRSPDAKVPAAALAKSTD